VGQRIARPSAQREPPPKKFFAKDPGVIRPLGDRRALRLSQISAAVSAIILFRLSNLIVRLV